MLRVLSVIVLLAIVLALFFPFELRAQDEGLRVARATFVEEPPTIDGFVNDAVWELADPITDFIQTEPVEGTRASEKTVVKIVYTDDAVFVGVICYDSEPDRILVTDTRRDASLGDTDSFQVIFDTYHDRQNGFVFGTNPAGIEHDGQVRRGWRLHREAAYHLHVRVAASDEHELSLRVRCFLHRQNGPIVALSNANVRMRTLAPNRHRCKTLEDRGDVNSLGGIVIAEDRSAMRCQIQTRYFSRLQQHFSPSRSSRQATHRRGARPKSDSWPRFAKTDYPAIPYAQLYAEQSASCGLVRGYDGFVYLKTAIRSVSSSSVGVKPILS